MRSFPKSGNHFNKKFEQVVTKKERNLSNESEEKFEDIENNLRRTGNKETSKIWPNELIFHLCESS